MKKENYIAGFDLVKLFGCIIVAQFHFFGRSLLSLPFTASLSPFFYELIPSFFIISGYLFALGLKNREPLPEKKSYAKKYIIKYAAVYCIIVTFSYLVYCTYSLLKHGTFGYDGILWDFITLPILNNRIDIVTQMWFLPPLLFGIILYAFTFLHGKGKIYRNIVLAVSVLSVIFIECLDYLFLWKPSLKDLTWLIPTVEVISRYVKGMLFVWIGGVIYENKEKFNSFRMVRALPLIIAVTVIEILIYLPIKEHTLATGYICFSAVLWSIVLFRLLLLIRCDKLRKWHTPITVFSVITYLFHPLEHLVLYKIVPNLYIVALLVFSLNAAVTAAFVWYKNRKTAASRGSV